MSDGGLWEPLAHRDYARLWRGFLVSHAGDAMQMHAQAWLVTELTHSGTALGGVVLAQALPRLFLGIFAGVIVDRVDRRRLLIVTQTLAMLQSLLFFALVATHTVTYGRVLILAVALGTFDTLNLNARITLMPTLVPPPLIARAIALQALSVNVVQIAGPALAAVLIGTTGVAGCLLANAGTFVVALVALAWMESTPARSSVPPAGFATELREGFAFARARPMVWASILLAWSLGLFGMGVNRLLALFASVVLHTTGPGYAVLATALGLGALAASVLVTARASTDRLPRNIVVAAVVFSLGVVAMAFANVYVAAFGALMLVGGGQMASRSAVTTVIQTVTPNRLRGRVISLLTLDFSLWSVGAIALGSIADLLARRHYAAHLASLATGHGAPLDFASAPLAVRHAALNWSLTITFVAAGIACLLATAALAAIILRHKVELAPQPSAAKEPERRADPSADR